LNRTIIFVYVLALASALCLFHAEEASAASCVDGGCHSSIAGAKYIHGPVAVERYTQQGCVMCHVPSGASCTVSSGGTYSYKAEKRKMCTSCHDAGTGTTHTGDRVKCLSCHNPHGSDDSSQFLRRS